MIDLTLAADVAYGTFYPATNTKITGKERAWKGDPEANPMMRPLRAALQELEDEGYLLVVLEDR